MSYILETTPTINIPLIADNPVIEELMQNYTYGAKWNIIRNLKNNCITMGNYKESNRGNAEFVINVTDDGVYIEGCDYSATMRGFLTFLEKIQYSANEDYFYIENCCITENPSISFRCVHLCIFPETKLDFLKKCVRSCAIAKYSHIIFEFWGMLKFDCMKELSWPFAYSKEEIKKIVSEANALGVEIIPMFNHLGHASACREINGKHVVLDQNPQMEYLFESYGWVWNLKRDDVRSLLSKVREELIDICGEGKYFHIGCDEAYSYAHNTKNAEELAEYLNTVCADLLSKGRRMIMWHDMLLSPDEFKGYTAFSDKDVSEILLEKLNKKIIIADWEYYSEFECSWKTSKALKKHGFDVLCCPWYQISNIHEAIETVLSNGLYGVIITTWHTLQRGFREMIYAGACAYDKKVMGDMEMQQLYCSHVARKALPSYGEYEKCGWSEKMTGPGSGL
ncbi:MAG: family 20 glycosylhydrolase [Clostridia bacterium]|nr:family 20 glycosylhydrolase [Clostridia bacterium]